MNFTIAMATSKIMDTPIDLPAEYDGTATENLSPPEVNHRFKTFKETYGGGVASTLLPLVRPRVKLWLNKNVSIILKRETNSLSVLIPSLF